MAPKLARTKTGTVAIKIIELANLKQEEIHELNLLQGEQTTFPDDYLT